MDSFAADIALSPEALKPPFLRLDHLPKDTRAEIVELPRGLGASRRLADLGIFVGCVVRVERSAPLGGPVLVEVGGSLVALGRQLAGRVVVRILP